MKQLLTNKQFNNAIKQLEDVLKKRWYELLFNNTWFNIIEKPKIEFKSMKNQETKNKT